MNTTECLTKLTRKHYFRWCYVLSGITLAALNIALFIDPAFAQTLDEAVTRQLELGPNGVPCEALLAGRPLSVLDGPLGQSPGDLCGRGPGIAGDFPSNSTGGGAGTPTVLPSIVQQQLRETAREEKKLKIKPKSGGASADRVAKFGSRLNVFYSGQYKNLDRDVTTFEDGYDSDIWRVTANTDAQVTDRIVRGPEEVHPKIAKASFSGSHTVLANHQLGSLAMSQAQLMREANSDAMQQKPKPFEIAMGPFKVPVIAEQPKPAPEELTIATEPEQPFQHSLGLWGVGEYEDLDRDRTSFEDGYDSDIWRVTVGADYMFTDRIVAGLAFDYYQHDGDFDGGGDFNHDSYGFLGFGAFRPFDHAFVQFYGGYSFKEYDRTRRATFREIEESSGVETTFVSGNPAGDYDVDQYSAGILVDYDYSIGNVSIVPRAGFDLIHTDFETYSEKGNSGLELTFHDDDQTLLQSRVGVQAAVAFRAGFGEIVPQASVDWRHEFENDQRSVNVSFVGDTGSKRFSYETEKPDRDWFEINAGVVAVLDNKLQVFGNYRTIVGHSFFDSNAGTIGLRYSF